MTGDIVTVFGRKNVMQQVRSIFTSSPNGSEKDTLP
jgi:hypothetical protein